MSRNLFQRLLVAAIAIPALIWLFSSGQRSLLQLFIALLSALAAGEFAATVSWPWKWLRALFILCAALIAVVSMVGGVAIGLVAYFGAFMALSVTVPLSRKAPTELYSATIAASWGLGYVSLLYPFLYHVCFFEGVPGFIWTLFLFSVMWVGDTVAMWVGKSIGKRPLAPLVSPHKTVEGFAGGLAGSVVVSSVFSLVTDLSMPALSVIAIGIVLSLVGQLGDMVKSLWKRAVGIKDSSNLIPGHGGVIDRFDSLAYAAPTLYFILSVLRP